MCGIVGYIGAQDSTGILIDGLRKLEYRGYDSAGVALVVGGQIRLRRSVGKLAALEASLAAEPLAGPLGIGHTRWATHGRPSENNAHPHVSGDVALVHNGIIENHLALREELAAKGHVFGSETDTEIVAHLIDEYGKGGMDFEQAVRAAVKRLEGAYALCVVKGDQPDRMIVARKSSPLIVGIGEGENFVASDVPAIIRHTKQVVFLQDLDVAVVAKDGVRFMDLDGNALDRPVRRVQWDPIAAEKGGHKHFMHKEIHEQPQAIINMLGGRVSLERGEVQFEDFGLSDEYLKALTRVRIVACGTAYHAGMVGKYLIEEACRLPVEVDLASEFRYRDPIVEPGDLLIVVSQSGETADTLAAVEAFRAAGGKVLGILNAIESSIARRSDAVIYTHAGPEIGVASTKAFVTQVTAMFLLAIHLARVRGTMDLKLRRRLLGEVVKLPVQVQEVLAKEGEIRLLAKEYRTLKGFLFLGRGPHYPIALEGALKLKEISYLHAEGYAAGEMKHGPIALIDEEMLAVVLCQKSRTYDKMLSNIEEVKARMGKLFAVAEWDDEVIRRKADHVFTVPAATEMLQPILAVVPLQLLAYHIADLKGNDVDQPRNLAKSVTVE
jgi:glucosamine--fructose-6-phosphate aminotransferase (isomerizing)